jgi:hypothetical protein
MVQYFPVITGSLTVNGDIIVSGTSSMSASNAISSSLALDSQLLSGTGSVGFTTTGSFTAASSSLSSRTTQIESVYATTGSNSFRATQSITGSLTVTGQIVAQTLNVQQVTSSIVYSSGSNVFGCDLNSRQTFTGSVLMTGSLIVNTTGPELQVNNNGVIIGNLLTDNHSITGSLRITGSNVIITGALCGTSATFTEEVSARNGNISIGLDATYSIPYMALGWGGRANANNKIYAARDTTDGIIINAATGRGVSITTNGGATLALSITCAGAATFSSDVIATTGLQINNLTLNTPRYLNFSANNSTFCDYGGSRFYNFQWDALTKAEIVAASDGALSNGKLVFKTSDGGVNATDRMTIKGNGNVGIGTCSPLSALQVSAIPSTNGDSVYQIVAFDTNTATSRVGAGISFGGYYNGTTDFSSAFASIKGFKENATNNDFAGAMSFQTRVNGGASTERMRITSAGVVSINSSGGEANAGLDRFTMGYFVSNYGWMQTWSSTPLYLNRLGNNVSAFGSAGFGLVTTTSSDVRIKKNIVSIESALDKVNALRGVYFEFDKNNELKVSVPHSKTRVGLIAQEVETIIPEAVIDGDNEGTPKSVDYTGLVGVLVKAIQELTQKVNALENK